MNVIFVLAALIATAVAGPVESKAIDWVEVSNQVAQVHTIVEDTLHYVIDEAKRGNEQIGEFVENYLETQIPVALGILAEVNAEIEAQTLTHEKAQEYFDRLEVLLFAVVQELLPYIAELPTENRDNIREELEESVPQVFDIAERIYELLQQ